MARPTVVIVIFFLAFNLFSGMMISTGFADTLGIDATVGEDEAVDQAVQDSENVSSGTSTGSTLFGMYQTLSGQVGGLLSTIFPGLRMLERAGTPKAITQGFLGPLFSVMIGLMVMSFLRGWDL